MQRGGLLMATICSDASFHSLWNAANASRDLVSVQRFALADVITCALDSGQVQPDALIPTKPRAGAKYVVVDRKLLFDFMQEHSCVCHAKEVAARKEASRAP